MNLENYTKICLGNINKKFQCIKPKSYINPDTGKNIDFIDCRVGKKFLFVGFVCAVDEFSVMLESEAGSTEIINNDEFTDYFKILKNTDSLST